MSTLRKHGRPPDHRKAKPKISFEVGAQPQGKRKAKGRMDASTLPPNLDPKYVLDICSGYQSLAKYYLREFPRCKVISIDIMDEEHALATLTAVERERVSYHKFDVTNLTIEKLEGILWKAYEIEVKDLTHLHWSPMCPHSLSARGAHVPVSAHVSCSQCVLRAARVWCVVQVHREEACEP